LKESTIEKFGQGKQKDKNTVEWIGDNIIANFGEFTSGRCYLNILSFEIQEEIINQSKQKSQSKAKEGSEKGF